MNKTKLQLFSRVSHNTAQVILHNLSTAFMVLPPEPAFITQQIVYVNREWRDELAGRCCRTQDEGYGRWWVTLVRCANTCPNRYYDIYRDFFFFGLAKRVLGYWCTLSSSLSSSPIFLLPSFLLITSFPEQCSCYFFIALHEAWDEK